MSGFERGRGRGGSSGQSGGGRGDGGRSGGGGGGRGDGGGRGGSGGAGRGYGGGRGEGGGGRGGGGRGEDYGGRGRGGGRGEDYSGRGRGGDVGGRGRGPEGGRGGGRGGPPPLSGKNRQMGDVESVRALLRAPGMNDNDILLVINPPASERDRSASLAREVGPRLPGHSEWRNRAAIGAMMNLGGPHIVRTNHYKLDTHGLVGAVYHYHVHIYKLSVGTSGADDVAQTEDERVNLQLLNTLQKRHPEWEQLLIGGVRRPGRYAYDGKSALYTNGKLPLADRNSDNQPFVSNDIGVLNQDGTESDRKRYRVTLTEVSVINLPPAGSIEWTRLNTETLQSLDVPLVNFARQCQLMEDPAWFISGQKIFASMGVSIDLGQGLEARRGFYASLKSCMAGPVLVVDMSINVFLSGGPLTEVVLKVMNYRNMADLEDACNRGGFTRKKQEELLHSIKNSKMKLLHLGHSKKIIGLGPAADSSESAFEHQGRNMTVAQYFETMARTDPRYQRHLHKGKLRYPKLPTVNVGSKTRPVLIPMELVHLPGGQSKNQLVTPDMTAQIIRYAAIRPDERFRAVMHGEENQAAIVNVLKTDDTNGGFGLNGLSAEPMAVPAVLLPPARIQYGGGAVIDPSLEGGWNMDRPQQRRFARQPPNPGSDGGYKYGIMIVGQGPPPGSDWQQKVMEFCAGIERDAQASGLKLSRQGNPATCADTEVRIKQEMGKFKDAKVRIVLVLMSSDCYGLIKLAGDPIGMMTQCVKWKNVDRPPRGFHLNVVLKINTKLGGTSHTLASRLPGGGGSSASGVFQDPPASLSWIFDKPCMMVGIDVSHPEPGSDKPSMAAVVASMDGRANQYAAHLSTQSSREEMVSNLEDALKSLLELFKAKNKKFPERILVYRDGVSEGQFEQVLNLELPRIQGALELLGIVPGTVKIAIVVCQKRHHTRVVYEERTGGDVQYVNPCPGLLLDYRGGNNSISSGTLNEFYLNSHATIQGTSKPCKYSLIYDEIGFRLSELELLTYWSTYLYVRCNKSVSYASPAYYAHWASKRCKELTAKGATNDLLAEISHKWSRPDVISSMFFI